MSKIKKNTKPAKTVKVTENLEPNKVKMVFSEHKFYNDLNTPIFEAGKVYELEGAGWIQRWLKRGGNIVEGDFSLPEVEINPSALVGSTLEVASGEEKVEDSADTDEGDIELADAE